MLKTVYVFHGLVSAFDVEGHQCNDEQGEIVALLYRDMRRRGVVDDATVFKYIDNSWRHQMQTGAEMEERWKDE